MSYVLSVLQGEHNSKLWRRKTCLAITAQSARMVKFVRDCNPAGNLVMVPVARGNGLFKRR